MRWRSFDRARRSQPARPALCCPRCRALRGADPRVQERRTSAFQRVLYARNAPCFLKALSGTRLLYASSPGKDSASSLSQTHKGLRGA